MRYPTHEQVVKLAKRELGVKEWPLGSNTGKRVREYQRATWLGGSNWPWCVAFWQFLLREAGFKMPYLGAGAYAMLDWARKQGWAVPSRTATPGDAVVFNIGAGHLAVLAEPVYGNSVTTIDGNVSHRVKEVTRPLSQVRGFVHFPEAPVVLKPARPPVFEVVSSASGHRVLYVSGARAVGRKLAQILKRHPSVTIRRRKKG